MLHCNQKNGSIRRGWCFMPEEKSDTKNAEGLASDTKQEQPLAGLRVLDLGNMVAASYCSRMFADFGAEVIKVELPRGDPMRGWRTHYKGIALFWALLGRNKRTLTLNLRHAVGQEVARKLAARCD